MNLLYNTCKILCTDCSGLATLDGWLYCVTYSKWIAAEAMWKQRVAPASDAVLDCFMHAGCHSPRGPAASVSMS